jgi:hypothetical protein
MFVIFLGVTFLLPFIYLTCLACVYSSYVHTQRFPSRTFMIEFAAPSNEMVKVPGLGRAYSNYFQLCLKFTGAGNADSVGHRKLVWANLGIAVSILFMALLLFRWNRRKRDENRKNAA